MIANQRYSERLERAGDWIAMFGRSDISSAAKADFQTWLSDAVNRRAFDDMLSLWNDFESLAGLARQDFPGMPDKLRVCIANRGEDLPRRQPRRRMTSTGFAVAACLTAMFSLLIWQLWMPHDPETSTLRTEKGGYRKAVLEDGSSVHLNTATVIDVMYSRDKRQISLRSGEAYFSVVKDVRRPFIVEAEGGSIRAVGTAFNVKTTSDHVELTVVEGTVEVAAAHGDDDAGSTSRGAASVPDLRITGGQSLVYGKSIGSIQDVPDHTIQKITSWKNGRVYFDDMPLKDIIHELNRYSQPEILIVGSELGNIRGSGMLHTRDVDAYLRGLEAALPLKVMKTQSNSIALIPDMSVKTTDAGTLDSSR